MENGNNVLDALEFAPGEEYEYEDWLKIGMALKHEGYDFDVWDNWSRNDPKYSREDNLYKWNSFGEVANPVGAGTIIELAKEHGFVPKAKQESSPKTEKAAPVPQKSAPVSPDVSLSAQLKKLAEKIVYVQEAAVDPDPWGEKRIDFTYDRDVHDGAAEMTAFIQALFKPDDLVNFVTSDVKRDASGKLCPLSGETRKAGELVADILEHKDDPKEAVGAWDEEAGAWIRMNPTDGKGVSDGDITDFRYALIEFDHLPILTQIKILEKLDLPTAAVVYSGGKSIHSVIKIDAKNAKEYAERVNFLYSYLDSRGYGPDKANKNPSRLTRLPGVTRNGRYQRLMMTNVGPNSWYQWISILEETSDGLPEMDTLSKELITNNPPLAPEVIEGVLRKGHKMILSGPSKAGKSFLLIELAVAIAEGKKWLGFSCTRGSVLYINLEIDRPSFIERVKLIYEEMNYPLDHPDNLTVWTLRGKSMPLDQLVPYIIRRCCKRHFDVIIIDPIYKVLTGDENSASDMGYFCNQFDMLCSDLGVSVIYCHHHPKGDMDQRSVQDRASGSGVFARDPDAQLDLTPLDISNVKYDTDTAYLMACTAWKMESVLREFASFQPIKLWFAYPIHIADSDVGNLLLGAKAKKPGGKQKGSGLNQETIDTAFEGLASQGEVRLDDLVAKLGMSEQHVRRTIKSRCGDSYLVKNGVVSRV